MKLDRSTESDEPLRTVLREWKTSAPLPPRFQEQVWRRIERQEKRPSLPVSLSEWLAHWIGVALPRPALAVSYVAILLTLGAGVGWTHARRDTARINGELSLRYVSSIDPYQNVR